ncbi:MAG: protein kinase [Gammaproteobacteria bacterium]
MSENERTLPGDGAETVTRMFEESWNELGPYLDTVLELEREERAAWLANLAERLPAIADRVRGYLVRLDALDECNFLGAHSFAALAAATLAGQRVGAYTLEKVIGYGGMGTVWLGHRSDGRFEGRVAVKLLNTALVGHPSERRFTREGSVLAKLQHPNIAHLLDAGLAGGTQPYLVLEYVPGARIDQYCEQHTLSIGQRVRLFLDVLGAVAHAHTNLIVHRDIKPSNILVTEHGVVKLLDFGIAALLSSDVSLPLTQLTHPGGPGLTPGFAAPEQLRGEAVTTATDVYSLGLVLFVLLTGRHPAPPEHKTAAELMRSTLDTDAPRPSEVATDARHQQLLRGDLDNIMAMALRRNSAERYSTVEQLAEDLRRHLALEPVSARPNTFGYLAARFVRRHRLGVALAAAIIVLLVGAVVITTLQRSEAQRQRDEARFQARRAEASGDFLNLLMLSDLGPAHPARTFHERLELGVELLEKQYQDDDPQFAGRMLVELANHFRDNEETDRANQLYAQANDIGRRHQDIELMAAAQCARAHADTDVDGSANVMQRIEDAQKLLGRLPHPDATVRAECLMARAGLEQRTSHGAATEALLRQAMKVLESSGNTHRQIYVSVLIDLGSFYLERNQPSEDLRLLQLAGAIEDANGRGGTAARLLIRQNAAVALSSMGEVRAALAEREIINQRMQAFDSAGQQTATLPRNYATLLLRMARPEESLRIVADILERARRAGNSYVLAYLLFTTGSAYTELRRWDEAESALKEAASLVADGPADRSVRSQAESFFARLDLARGNLPAARRHSDLSLSLAGYGTPEPQRPLARLLLVAAQVALATRAPGDAERFARDALAIFEPIARGPATSADVGEGLLRLSQARIASGERAEANSLLERAVRCLSNGLGPDHPLTVEARRTITPG